jgi:hypothetical protein
VIVEVDEGIKEVVLRLEGMQVLVQWGTAAEDLVMFAVPNAILELKINIGLILCCFPIVLSLTPLSTPRISALNTLKA